MIYTTITTTLRGYVRQFWRDLLSVYYANTPIWRWLKSGALLFGGFGLWAASTVMFSVTGWIPLRYTMAYGFLLVFWGPFTHMVLVPFTIRLRRNAETNACRIFARNSGKINLSIFFTCVILLATVAPGLIMLEFSPSDSHGGPNVSGDLFCDPGDEVISCEVPDPQGIDHVVVKSGGERLMTIESEPFEFEVRRDELKKTQGSHRFVVEYRDADGNTVRRLIERV